MLQISSLFKAGHTKITVSSHHQEIVKSSTWATYPAIIIYEAVGNF